MTRKLVAMEGKVEAVNSKVVKFDTGIKAAEGRADKAAKRKLQVEVGTVKLTKPTTLVFIFSEHWPSGSFVAKSLGVTRVYTNVQWASLGFEESLRHGGLGETCLP